MGTPYISLNNSLQILEAIEEKDVALFKAVYPKVYREPRRSSYHSPTLVASQLAQIALKVRQGMWGTNEQEEFKWATVVTRYGVPTYFIGQALMEALGKTAIPGKVDWYDMPLPFDGGVFLPPRGTLIHPTEGDVVFIGYSRYRDGVEYVSELERHLKFSTDDEGLTIVAMTAQGYFYHRNVCLKADTRTVQLHRINEHWREHGAMTHRSAWPLQSLAMSPEDHEFTARVIHFVFATLMVMAARPTIVSSGSLDKRIRHKRFGDREFWLPTVIGENYGARYVRPSGSTVAPEGSHASPRLHWVSGYTRQQRFGVGRTQVMTKWIEPFVRGRVE